MFKFSNKKLWLVALPVFVAVATALLFLPTYREGEGDLDEVAVTDSAEVQEMVYEYGIPADRYRVQYGIVQPRQNLGSILGEHGVSTGTVHHLGEKARGVFDVRRIRSGQAYALFFSKHDSLAPPRFFRL